MLMKINLKRSDIFINSIKRAYVEAYKLLKRTIDKNIYVSKL